MERLSRRNVMLGGVLGIAAVGGVFALGGRNLYYAAITEDVVGGQLTAAEAYQSALAGDVLLIDIRRPDEWAASGSGEGAVRLDMRRADFIEQLAALTDNNPAAPVALICARGVRSARLTNQLTEAGFTNILDVPEGMFGSAAGPGWHAAGLPVDRS